MPDREELPRGDAVEPVSDSLLNYATSNNLINAFVIAMVQLIVQNSAFCNMQKTMKNTKIVIPGRDKKLATTIFTVRGTYSDPVYDRYCKGTLFL